MGKKSEKLPKEKIRVRFQNIPGLVFSLPKRGRNNWRIQKEIWAGATRRARLAAKPHKHPGRSRPNRAFRPRSFFRVNFRSVFFCGDL
jgi:hypothetical protein